MTTRTARSLVWWTLGASVVLKVVAAGLIVITPEGLRPSDGFGFLAWAPGVLAFGVVGALIVSRQPRNAVGWIFFSVGVAEPVFLLAEQYARIGMLVQPGLLPGAALVGVLGAALSSTNLASLLLIGLLFPTGHLPSRRWRPLIVVVGGWLASITIATLFSSGPISETLPVPNPLAAPGDLGRTAADVRDALDVIGAALLLVTAPALIVRWRRSQGLLRAQLTWLVFAIAMLMIAVVIIIPIWEIGLLGPIPPAVDASFTLVLVATVAGIPIAAGIAILRHGLYDIHVVVRRSLVYGAVVAILATVYIALVLATQALLAGITQNQTLPVALSTLVIAALFGPVRRRVRELVDRRFYRFRYDAQQTLEVFAARLRDEVELETVDQLLVAVASDALHPTSVGLWIRGARS